MVFGFLLRLYSSMTVPLINTDGFLYIQQAKALHFGLKSQLTACHDYLSAYPVFISAVYPLFQDWILAARWVALGFSCLTFVPLYWLLRQFFNERTSALSLLVFVSIPSFVDASRDLLRDPLFWCFLTLALHLIIFSVKQGSRKSALAASLCFLLATWARIEGAAVILLTAVFIPFIVRDRPWRHLLVFLSPQLCMGAAVAVYVLMVNPNVLELLDIERFLEKPKKVADHYHELRAALKALNEYPPQDLSPYFLPKVRNLIWLIALGTVAVYGVETFFYPFFALFLLGAWGSIPRIRKDPCLIYLAALSVMALAILYAHVMHNWSMASRFFALFLFSSFFIMGFGVEKITDYLSRRRNLKPAATFAATALLILVCSLPKNLRADFVEDKLIFKEIGRFIAAREEGREAVTVAGAFKRIRVVHFYANLPYAGAPCFDDELDLDRPAMVRPDYLIQKGVRYYLRDEKSGARFPTDWLSEEEGKRFVPVKTWTSERLGKITLYKVTP